MPANDLATYVDILRRWRKFIVRVVGITTVASVAVSFLLPKWYSARSTLISPQESGFQSSVMSLMGGLNAPGIAGLTAGSPASQLFLAILDSRTLREKLILDFKLKPVYRAKTMDDALKTFSKLARVNLTDRGVVEVVVEDKNPQRAADIANAWVVALDDFNKNARMTTGKKTRLFVEERIRKTEERLRAAEDALAAYQRTHKTATLAAGLSRGIESGASILAQRMVLSVRLNRLTGLYRHDSPELEQTRADLAALDQQIDELPPLAMEYARLLRDMKVQEQVYQLLVAQYEEARIQENKDTPTVEVLDVASRPERKVRPVRWLFCASLVVAAGVLSLGTAFTAEALRGSRRTDHEAV
jgi:tyrosine-protein kinase Etk/Wzc